jgi:peptidoglycan/LPS O-acetylase OafA/YrhL
MITIPGLFEWFAVGLSLAVFRAEFEVGRPAGWLQALARRPGLCVLLSFVSFMTAAHFQHGDVFLAWDAVVPHVAIGLGSGLLVLAVMVSRSQCTGRNPWPLRVLGHPRVAWLGTLSYGVYLWHLPLLRLITSQSGLGPAPGAIGQFLLLWAVVIAGGLALGAASFYLVERPCQRLLRSRGAGRGRGLQGGRMDEIDTSVHSTLDPLNSSAVVADHLA